jgi:hypothetical protein
MSKLDEWADKQLAGMKQGATEIGQNIVSDVGATYQAFLMSDAVWRVPRAHGEVTMDIAEQAAAAELEKAIETPAPQLDADIEPDH